MGRERGRSGLTARHSRPPEPERPPGPPAKALTAVANRVRHTLALCNLAAAAALLANRPGTSPTLAFLQHIVALPVWAIGFAAAAALLLAGRTEVGHVCAVTGWLMLAYAAVAALVTDNTRSPSGSILFAGLLVSVASLHVIGLLFRIQSRRLGPR